VGQEKNRDLIYQPLIRAGNFWHVPMNLIARSNFIRNALALSELRFHNAKDPLGALLADTLRGAGANAWHDVGFKYGGQEGDIDCLALLDGILFFFECKNALHPCGIFELRNTRQHLNKAATQLDRIDGLLQTTGFTEYLSNKLRHDLPSSGPRVGAIVLGHRLFSGYTFKGFEVRSAHELVHFIREGDGTILGQQIRIRPEGSLTAVALVEYLIGRGFHDRLFEAMIPDEQRWKCSACEIVEHTYKLDPEALSLAFGIVLPTVNSATDTAAS
jgi:hypothetical protein